MMDESSLSGSILEMCSTQQGKIETVAEAFLSTLKDRGVDYLYVGAGTDTAPLIEAYARQAKSGLHFPTAIVAAHENLAVGMAHGHYMVSGKPQAVMLHVSVGAANAVCGLMNAGRSQVPMFFSAGRTPLFESGPRGARDNTIHWGQEMFDQASMVREFVKWDYELRDGGNLADVVDRGLSISMTVPRGPIYLTLPREVLASRTSGFEVPVAPAVPCAPHPDPSAVSRLAEALMKAEFPAIVCTASGADPDTVPLLVELADRFGIAVGESKPRFVNFPTTHALHAGFDMEAILAQSDALLFLECDVPWLPGKCRPRQGAFVAHAGTNPLFERYPLRSFPSNLSITTSIAALLPDLARALESAGADRDRAERRAHASAFAVSARHTVLARATRDENNGGAITKIFLSRCLDEVRSDDTILVNEYSAVREQLTFDRPGTFFLHPNAGGLGWGLPAALGAQQAAPERSVMAVLGDGAYIFCNPAACHQASAMHSLPLVTVVFDNGGWDAVQSSALAMYPDTHTAEHATRHGSAPLSSLHPVPDFTLYARASGGHGECVTNREELVPALRRALDIVRRERRQALVHVIGR